MVFKAITVVKASKFWEGVPLRRVWNSVPLISKGHQQTLKYSQKQRRTLLTMSESTAAVERANSSGLHDRSKLRPVNKKVFHLNVSSHNLFHESDS